MEFEETPVQANGHLAAGSPAAAPPAGEPAVGETTSSPEELRRQRRIVFGLVAAGVVFLALVVLGVIWLLNPGTPTDKIRDIFIIFMALESLLIGFVLVILVVQLARLTNLLQNEIKPILNSTNETIDTLRGTVTFLSNHLVEPVVKINEVLAALQPLRELFRFSRKK